MYNPNFKFVNEVTQLNEENMNNLIEGINSKTGLKTKNNGEIFNDYINNVANLYGSHAEGGNQYPWGSDLSDRQTSTDIVIKGCTANGLQSHAEGGQTFADGYCAHAEGTMTEAIGENAHSEGLWTIAKADSSHASGVGTIASSKCQTCIGQYNVEHSDSLFIMGNGKSDNRSNGFRVSKSGTVYGNGAYNSSGADYAEMFEWKDGNSKNIDRRGLFVTLDGEKIKLATSIDTYILGIVSVTPAILGDCYFGDKWHKKYLTDVFGEYITEVTHIEEHDEILVPAQLDDRGNILKEAIIQKIPEHDEINKVINPNFDANQEYISRENRKEWASIGLIGKLIVVDDGTCEVNGYCKPSTGGKATKSDIGYRVMSRIDKNHIKILFK